MLTKLLKYEFKASARMYGGLYLAVLAAAALMGLRLGAENEHGSSGSNLGVMLTLVYTGLCIALVVITLMTVVSRFKGNLLGREGYLMHTLPVTTRQLIGAKLLSSTVWGVCSVFVGCVSLVLALVFYSLANGVSPLELLSEAKQLVLITIEMDYWVQLFFALAVIVLAASVAMILCIYASIMVGHQFKKHPTLAGIVAFFAFSLVQGWVQSFSSIESIAVTQPGVQESIFAFADGAGEAELIFKTASLWGSVGVYVLECAVFALLYFALTAWLMENRLNLE